MEPRAGGAHALGVKPILSRGWAAGLALELGLKGPWQSPQRIYVEQLCRQLRGRDVPGVHHKEHAHQLRVPHLSRVI